MKLVSIFMDVEDPINPLADDAARDFAAIFTQMGIRGSFCITGDKCRSLLRRDRADVVEALARHCLGLHTDTHSVHPTTMELLADLDYPDGCEVAFAAESKGATAFRDAFHRTPAFWGGAGNTWSPEIPHALCRLGIPAYVYALTELPDGRVHRFNGAIALPQSVSVSEDALTENPVTIETTLGAIRSLATNWVGVFVGHPTRYRFPDYWDYSYYRGQNPAEPRQMLPVSDERYEQSKDRMRELLSSLASRWRIVGVDELTDMPLGFRRPTPEETNYFREATASNLRGAAKWPIHRSDLDPANIVAKTLALANSLEVCDATW